MTVSLLNQAQPRYQSIRPRFGNETQPVEAAAEIAKPEAEVKAAPPAVEPKPVKAKSPHSFVRRAFAKSTYGIARALTLPSRRPSINLAELTTFDQLNTVYQKAQRDNFEENKLSRRQQYLGNLGEAIKAAGETARRSETDAKAAVRYFARLTGERKSSLIRKMNATPEAEALVKDKAQYDVDHAYWRLSEQFIGIQVYPPLPEGKMDKKTVAAWEARKADNQKFFQELFQWYSRLTGQSKVAARAKMAGDTNVTTQIAERKVAIKDSYDGLMKAFVDMKIYAFTHAEEIHAGTDQVYQTKKSAYDTAIQQYSKVSGEDRQVLKKRLELDRDKSHSFSAAEKEHQTKLDGAWSQVRDKYSAFAKSNAANDEVQLNAAMEQVKVLTGLDENDIINKLYDTDVDAFPGTDEQTPAIRL